MKNANVHINGIASVVCKYGFVYTFQVGWALCPYHWTSEDPAVLQAAWHPQCA